MSRLREEEAKKWNYMINMLRNLEDNGSIPKDAADLIKQISE